MAFENTRWWQSPMSTELALKRTFSREYPRRTQLEPDCSMDCYYDEEITLPVSGASPSRMCFGYWHNGNTVGLISVQLCFDSAEETDAYREYLDGLYGEAVKCDEFSEKAGILVERWEWSCTEDDRSFTVSYSFPNTASYLEDLGYGYFFFSQPKYLQNPSE